VTSPYGNKPSGVVPADEWHNISFNISVDVPVDWDKVDLRQWVHTVAKYTALRMAETTTTAEEQEDIIKTLILGVKVENVGFVQDDALHAMIDEFDSEGD